MRWPQELHFLQPLRQTYRRENILRCVLLMAAAFLGVHALLNLAAVFFPLPVPWRAGAGLAAALLLPWVCLSRRLTPVDISRRMDRELHSAERIQTYVELVMKSDTGEGALSAAEPPAAISALLLKEIKQHFKSRHLAAKFNWRSFRVPAAVLAFCLLLFLGSVVASPAISRTFNLRQEIAQAREEALEAMEELAALLAEEPLLPELHKDLEWLKEQVKSSNGIDEIELLLREALELLEQHGEELRQTEQALRALEEQLAGGTAAETAELIAQDPLHGRELHKRLEELLDSMPPGSARESLQEAASSLEAAAGSVGAREMEALYESLQPLDPASALQAIARGAEQLRRRHEAAGGSGEGVEGESNGENAGEGGAAGEGGSGSNGGQSGGENGGSGNNGSGSNNGTGQGQGGAGEETGSGEGEGGGIGGGAGSGKGPSLQHDFFLIPGEQELRLSGSGEEGGYTLQDIMRFNPDIAAETYTGYYQRYYRQGIVSQPGGHIPPALESYLRNYFEAIAPPAE